MSSILEYRGYHAKIEFDEEDMLLVGEVFGIQDSLNFHGTTIIEIVEAFHQSVDHYLALCEELGKNPDKEFKGSFNVRITQNLHREAAFAANRRGLTLNQFVEDAIKAAVDKREPDVIYVTSPILEQAARIKLTKGEIIPSSSNYKSIEKQY